MGKKDIMSGYTIWFTGLPGSNKEKISRSLVKTIRDANIPVVYLEDSELRSTLSYDLGFTRYDTERHTLRIIHTCYHLVASDVLNIVCSLSPSSKIRNYGRSLIGNEKFIEIFTRCSLSLCEERDVDNMYSGKMTKQNLNYHMDSLFYDVPRRPNIVLDTDKMNVNDCLRVIIDFLSERGIL
jgi:adenylylsulfate kinase